MQNVSQVVQLLLLYLLEKLSVFHLIVCQLVMPIVTTSAEVGSSPCSAVEVTGLLAIADPVMQVKEDPKAT
jgi:hypothetical protein